MPFVGALDSPSGTGRSDIAELAIRHAPRLYRLARSLTRDRDEAEDLVQETYLRALQRGDQYRADAPVEHWLVRILHNVAIDRARRSAREVLVEDVEAKWRDAAYTVDVEAVAERTETRAALEDALVRLPFTHRVVVMLHDIEGWTTTEIATALDIGQPAAKQRLRRGRMMLVSALAEGHERRARLSGVPLRCWDARRMVSDYVDDALPPASRKPLEAHLRTCPTCPPLLACLVGVKAGLDGLRDPDTVIPPEVLARIRSSLDTPATALRRTGVSPPRSSAGTSPPGSTG